MMLALITDAWQPQVNGVVTTLLELVREMEHQNHAMEPDAVHIATEGRLGWAARRYCLQRGLAFTTAFHTRFLEVLKSALNIPLCLGYANFRHFYKRSASVQVPTPSVLCMLEGRCFRNLRGWTHGLDMELFAYREAPQAFARLGVLARPVSLEVVGHASAGGVLHPDLTTAWYQALAAPRHEARARALDFSWAHASQLFVRHLVTSRGGIAFESPLPIHESVTQLSSESSTI